LAFLNAILVMVLIWTITPDNPAVAQAPARGRGEFLMIPADVPNAPNGIMFVLDTRNGLLGAFVYDSNQRALNVMQPIDLARLFGGPAGVGR
jgi:hypothetical protein